MTDGPAKSCRIFIRFGKISADCKPTDEDIRNIFSVHGNIIDVDVRAKFCFVEYDTDTAAQKAVDAENGREFKGQNLNVDFAVGPRRVRNDSSDVTSPPADMTSPPATDKKSSFAADEWKSQCEAAKVSAAPPESELNNIPLPTSQHVGELTTAKAAQPQWTSSNWHQTHPSPAAETVKKSDLHCHQPTSRTRSRSRSPRNSSKPAVQTFSSRKSHRSQSPSSRVERLRQMEVQLQQLSGSYDRELAAARDARRSNTAHLMPLKSALRRPPTLPAPLESYSTKYGRELDTLTSSRRYHDIDRHVESTLSQMKNMSKRMSSAPHYDDIRDISYNESTHHRAAAAAAAASSARCELFIPNIGYSDYAKNVAMRIERIGLLVHTSVVSGDADVMDAVSEAMRRGCLFALSIIGRQSSSTLYILHGQPEEHRNMLVEDAVAKIAQSYREYRQSGSTKELLLPPPRTRSPPITRTRSPPIPAPTLTSPALKTVPEPQQPDTATRRLIGLLSADCELTHSELEHIILYLRFRQKALVSSSDSTSTPQASVTNSTASSLPVDINVVNKLLLEAVKIASGR